MIFRIFVSILVLNQVYSDYELAHSKPSIQSSTMIVNNVSYSSSLALDGDQSTYSYFNSSVERNSWWQVDLGETTNITGFYAMIFCSECDSVITVIIGSTNATYSNEESVVCKVFYTAAYRSYHEYCYITVSDYYCNGYPILGRFVTILKKTAIYVYFYEVDIKTQENDYGVSRAKPARHSWTYNNYPQYNASKALDGNVSSCFIAGRSDGSLANAWWQVDLGEMFYVTRVSIQNIDRLPLFPAYGYMSSFVVFVDSVNGTDDPDPSKVCYNYPVDGSPSFSAGQETTLFCKTQPLRGRYITVRKKSGTDGRPDMMMLCEFSVYGYRTAFQSDLQPPTSSTTKLDKFSSSSQTNNRVSSSTMPGPTFSDPSVPTQGGKSSEPTDSLPYDSQSSKIQELQKNLTAVGVVLGIPLFIALIVIIVLVIRRKSSRTPDGPTHNRQAATNSDVAGSSSQQTDKAAVQYMNANEGKRVMLNPPARNVYRNGHDPSTYNNLGFDHPDEHIYHEISANCQTVA